MGKILIALTALMSKNVWALGSITAAATAISVGADPLAWVIGAVGATVTYAYKKPHTRMKALSNGLISICIGGIVAPFIGTLVAVKIGSEWANNYVFAFVLSSVWPWVMPILLNSLKSFLPEWIKNKIGVL